MHESTHCLIGRISKLDAVILDSGHLMVARHLIECDSKSNVISIAILHKFEIRIIDRATGVIVGRGYRCT